MDIEQRSGLRYIAEMGVAVALEIAVLHVRQPYLAPGASSAALRAVLLLLPVLPIWLMLAAVIRHYRRIDEYLRVKLLKIVALCAGIAVCVYTSYPFVAEAFGLKPLDIAWAWPIMGVCWIAATVLARVGTAMRAS